MVIQPMYDRFQEREKQLTKERDELNGYLQNFVPLKEISNQYKWESTVNNNMQEYRKNGNQLIRDYELTLMR